MFLFSDLETQTFSTGIPNVVMNNNAIDINSTWFLLPTPYYQLLFFGHLYYLS